MPEIPMLNREADGASRFYLQAANGVFHHGTVAEMDRAFESFVAGRAWITDSIGCRRDTKESPMEGAEDEDVRHYFCGIGRGSGWEADAAAFIDFFHNDTDGCGALFGLQVRDDSKNEIKKLGANLGSSFHRERFLERIPRIVSGTEPPPLTPEEQVANNLAMYAEMQAEWEALQAERRRKRRAAGLEDEAGTGQPAPAVTLLAREFQPSAALRKRQREANEDDDAAADALAETWAEEQESFKRATLRDAPPGAARVGGLPDLPAGAAWPTFRGRELPFIAQVDLRRLHDAAPGSLPPEGFLFFFALVTNDPEVEGVVCEVVHVGGDAAGLERAATPAPPGIWPDWIEQSVYEPLVLDRFAPRGSGRVKKSEFRLGALFGRPSLRPKLAGETADEEMHDGKDWIQLLQVESVGDMQWSDSGTLHFFVRRSDLGRGEFGRVLAAVESA